MNFVTITTTTTARLLNQFYAGPGRCPLNLLKNVSENFFETLAHGEMLGVCERPTGLYTVL